MIRKVLFNLICIFSCFTVLNTVNAEDVEIVNIRVDTISAPKDVTGLILYPDRIEEIKKADLTYIPSGKYYLVSYPVPKEIVADNRVLFSAVLTSEKNEVILGNIKDLATAFQYPITNTCEKPLPEALVNKPFSESNKKLEQVCTLRESRREANRSAFLRVMSRKVGTKYTLLQLANRFAEGFTNNFGQPDKIDFSSESMQPLTLVKQLSKLEHILKGYQINNSKPRR